MYAVQNEDDLSTILVDLRSGEVVLHKAEIIDTFMLLEHGAFITSTYYSFESGESFTIDEWFHPAQVIDVVLDSIIFVTNENYSNGMLPGIYIFSKTGDIKLLVDEAVPIEDFWVL